MDNKIEIHIGERNPREYWDELEKHYFHLFTTCKNKGWIGKESGRDKETIDFSMDFMTRMQDQRPPRIRG